jgi:hypothetical protein
LAAKSLEFANQEDERPIKLFFQDEARFGRIDNASACWVPPGGRAQVGNQIIRKYTYLYGAFCPETGDQFSMILPHATGECMDIFLKEFSKQFAHYRVIMGMDNAPWHNSEMSKHIVPLFQPAYSPELNPAEHIWQHIRENGEFKNRTFNTIQEVEDNLCKAVNTLLTDKIKIKSITGFKWILNAIQNNMIAV